MTTKKPELTVFDVVTREHDGGGSSVIFADRDLSLLFTWDGRTAFRVFQDNGPLGLVEMDGWDTDVAPRDADEAKERCRSRLRLIRGEAAAADAEPGDDP